MDGKHMEHKHTIKACDCTAPKLACCSRCACAFCLTCGGIVETDKATWRALLLDSFGIDAAEFDEGRDGQL